jgi:ElaB/YqjD/DUF883 family membrane-anchored ribosome-binding protein
MKWRYPMSTASTISGSMRGTTNEAREAIRDIGKAATTASGDIQKDLQKLRDDITRLAEQVADILGKRGSAAWQHATPGMDEAASEAQAQGSEAAETMHELSDRLVEAIDDSIKNRPYTTLAMALGLGFLFGATWRR